MAAGYAAEKSREGADGPAAPRSTEGRRPTERRRLPPTSIRPGQRPLAYDLHGVTPQVDLRRLPRSLEIPPAETNVNAAYHVVGSEGRAAFNQEPPSLDPSTVAGAMIASGTTAEMAGAG